QWWWPPFRPASPARPTTASIAASSGGRGSLPFGPLIVAPSPSRPTSRRRRLLGEEHVGRPRRAWPRVPDHPRPAQRAEGVHEPLRAGVVARDEAQLQTRRRGDSDGAPPPERVQDPPLPRRDAVPARGRDGAGRGDHRRANASVGRPPPRRLRGPPLDPAGP